MKGQRKQLVLAALGLALVAGGSSAGADIPRLVHFQGRLSTNSGAFLPGPVTLRARLYNHPTQASPVLFDETHGALANQLMNGGVRSGNGQVVISW